MSNNIVLEKLLRKSDLLKLQNESCLQIFRREIEFGIYEFRFLSTEKPNFKFSIRIKVEGISRCSVSPLKVNAYGNSDELIEKWRWVSEVMHLMFGINSKHFTVSNAH